MMTTTSAATRWVADKGKRHIAARVVLLIFLLCASLVAAFKEVDIKEGEEEKKEKRTLHYSSISLLCKYILCVLKSYNFQKLTKCQNSDI